jgi:transcription initiation factor TFIID subunit 10
MKRQQQSQPQQPQQPQQQQPVAANSFYHSNANPQFHGSMMQGRPSQRPPTSIGPTQGNYMPVQNTAGAGSVPIMPLHPQQPLPSPMLNPNMRPPFTNITHTQQQQQQQTAPPSTVSANIPPHLLALLQTEGKKIEQDQDKALIDLLGQLEEFSPIIPDELVNHYMMKSGLDIQDVKIKRLLALLTQKYVTDVAQNALQYAKLRQNTLTSVPGPPGSTLGSRRLVLSMEDLTMAMKDYDVHMKKPPYYR